MVDLKTQFAYPLPGMLVAELIGMSDEARVAAAKMIDLMVDTNVTPEQAQDTLLGWRDAIGNLIEQKRAEPGHDITSDLIAARDEDGSRMTEQEMTDTVFAILGAGSETTINFIDNAVTLLLTHPEQLALVRSGEVSWEEVIEEVLRLQSPLASLPLRFAVADIELDGVTIPRGDPILVNYAALGRDPALHGESAADVRHHPHGQGAPVVRARPPLLPRRGHRPDAGQGEPLRAVRALPRPDARRRRRGPVPYPTFIMNGHRHLPVHLTGAVSAAA